MKKKFELSETKHEKCTCGSCTHLHHEERVNVCLQDQILHCESSGAACWLLNLKQNIITPLKMLPVSDLNNVNRHIQQIN